MSSTYECPRHGTVEMGIECPECLDEWKHRLPREAMTLDSIEEEMRRISGRLTLEFSKVHQRFEELVGRPVFTHEFIDIERLVKEARGDRPVSTLEEILEVLPRGTDVLIAVVGDV